MKENSLLATNPYLKNPKQRRKLIERSVISSSAIEGVYIDFKNSKIVVQQKRK